MWILLTACVWGNHPRQNYYQIWKEGGVLWNSPRHKSWILPRKQLLCSKNVSLFIPAWLILFILEKIRGCWSQRKARRCHFRKENKYWVRHRIKQLLQGPGWGHWIFRLQTRSTPAWTSFPLGVASPAFQSVQIRLFTLWADWWFVFKKIESWRFSFINSFVHPPNIY